MIRDRGKIKWQGFFMPEQVAMLKQLQTENLFETKPILDVYQVEEIESKIHLAMEYALTVKVKVWKDGFRQHTGRINRLDGIKKMIYLGTQEGYVEKILFDDILEVEVEE